MRRRPAYAKRVFRARLRAWLRVNWILFTFLALMCLALAVLESVFLSGYLLGLIHGCLLVGVPALVLVYFMTHTGAIWQLAGSIGEDNTRDELRKAKRRRLIWGWVDNIEVQGGDVDHLVLAPSGAMALDSKFHAVALDAKVLRRDVEAAQRAAAKASSVLRALKDPMPVLPVVVIWGSGARDVPSGGAVFEGVDVVRGHDIARWLKRPGQHLMGRKRAAQLRRRLEDFRARTNPNASPGSVWVPMRGRMDATVRWHPMG